MTGETDPFFGNRYTVETFPARQKTIINAQTGETVAIEDHYGNRVDFSFNGIKSNRGRSLQFERDWRGNISAITDPAGYPCKEEDVHGNATIYGFYEGRLYSTRDADFNSTGFDYDSFGSVSTVSQSNFEAGTGSSTSFDYNAFGDLTESVDELGQTVYLVSRTTYDAAGRAEYSTDSFPEAYFMDRVPDDTPASEVTGTRTVYNPTTGQVDRTEQLVGLEIDLLGTAPNQSAELIGTPTVVSLSQDANLSYSPSPALSNPGSIESVSETLYDSAGRAWRTISGRVPLTSVFSESSVAQQSAALADYPVHGGVSCWERRERDRLEGGKTRMQSRNCLHRRR